MAGIYLHIPYCRQACHYCNFHFSTSLKSKNDFVPALLKEAAWRKEYLHGETIETIYFGGGTPSLLTLDELQVVLEKLYELFAVDPLAEVTLEANPDDVNPRIVGGWKKAGINRLSVGVQSFFEEDLRWMNRAHHAGQAVDSALAALAECMDLNIDLIYGTPTLNDGHWQENVERAVSLGVPHLSCYALTVEPRTALHKFIAQKKMASPDTEDQARQFRLLMKWMAEAGYEHYEISNFALPGKRSRHNTAYWQGKKYLGLGPSAHSYDGRSRQWNVAGNTKYIRAIEHQELLFEKEDLGPVQLINEYIMTSLRTLEGLDVNYVAARFGNYAGGILLKRADKYIRTNQVEPVGQRLLLTNEGKLFADGIASDLFFENVDQPVIHFDDHAS
ncbi:MAG TPA: radical SAM family heme chaperone HemW [Puia sp.]|nr:radical SAM family heme chaperone HemW [Puia sp.]